MPAHRLPIATTLAALIAPAAFAAPANAYHCAETYTPHLDVAWAEGSTGVVPVGKAAVLVVADGDCKYRYGVPAAELRFSAAPTAAGPFVPVAIEKRGKLFAWRPTAPGTWFLRIDRLPDDNRMREPRSAAAIVLAHDPRTAVRAKLTFSARGRLHNVEGRIALMPALSEAEATGPLDECCADWLLPYLLLPGLRPPHATSARLPPGRYDVLEASTLQSATDDTGGGLRYVKLGFPQDGASGSVEVVAAGDVAVQERPVCKIPVHKH